MRAIESRVQKLEQATAQKTIAMVWWGEQSEADLEAEVAELEAKGFPIGPDPAGNDNLGGRTKCQADDEGEMIAA
jgi:hypothetical protein